MTETEVSSSVPDWLTEEVEASDARITALSFQYNWTTTWRRKGIVDVCGLPEVLPRGLGAQLRGPAGPPASPRRRTSGSPQTATIPFSSTTRFNLDFRSMWKDQRRPRTRRSRLDSGYHPEAHTAFGRYIMYIILYR